MQTCVIFNPSARGDRANAVYSSLDSVFPNCTWRRSTEPGQVRHLAAEAVRAGYSTVIAAGGDGTANEVVNGIGDVPGGFESTCFGVLPLGTINVFARELGFPLNLAGAARVLKKGKTRSIDLGCVKYVEDGGERQRYFVQLAGAGLDSRAIELVSWQLKKQLGPAAYLVAGVRALTERQPQITAHGSEPISGELVLIGNGRFYGGSLPVFPTADLEDGLLDVCVIPKLTWRRLVGAALGLLTGKFTKFCSALHFRLPSVKLTSTSRVILQLDGENACELPVTLSIRPRALQVIVP